MLTQSWFETVVRLRFFRSAVAVLFMVALAACGDTNSSGGTNTTGGGADPTLVSVLVSPGAVTLAPDATQTFTATGKMSDDSTTSITVQWSATAGTVTQAGAYTATATTGTAQVTATDTASGLAASATVTITAQGSSSWSSPFPLPVDAIHSAMLPSGKILMFYAQHGTNNAFAGLFDPATLQTVDVPLPAGWNPDCVGQIFLADGTLLLVGGTIAHRTGSNRSYIFDPISESWVRWGDMASGRWYPTVTLLPDGRALVISGEDAPYTINPDVEILDPLGQAGWQVVGQKTVPYYSNLHVMPDGLVFMSSPLSQTETYNPVTGIWTPIATTSAPHYAAPSLLVPGAPNTVMVIGGSTAQETGNGTKLVELIDLSGPTPIWRTITPMTYARVDHDAVILPDGKVFVVGGGTLIPELFDPQTETWQSMAPHKNARGYHSSAVLLPDGRVFVAGGEGTGVNNGEIFSPPYLSLGSRPAILSAPQTLNYGVSFNLNFSSSTTANKVILVRYSTATHSVNMEQRYVDLQATTSTGVVSVAGPANANLAPPGYYMLFVVDSRGVPSVSTPVLVN